jgi:hypothetical protein
MGPITIRLDLSPKDYVRLEKQALKRGLNNASTARMVVLEWLDKQEAGPIASEPDGPE